MKTYTAAAPSDLSQIRLFSLTVRKSLINCDFLIHFSVVLIALKVKAD